MVIYELCPIVKNDKRHFITMDRKHVYTSIRFLVTLVLMSLLTSCNIDDKLVGTYGSSDNIGESRINKLFIVKFVPNKFSFKLIDSSVINIDTAWAESLWIYNENHKPTVPDTIVGFNFILPFSKQNFSDIRNFRFDFANLDTLNGQGYGLQESKWVFNPKVLKDTIRILIQLRNPDTTLGWTRPIISDTLIYIKK